MNTPNTTEPEATPPVLVRVKLADIDYEPAKKGRAGLDAEAVERYAETEAEWYTSKPIDLFSGGGRVYAGDGWHRIEARLSLGQRYLMALVTHCPTAKDAERRATRHALSGRANRVHGVPRSKADKRAAVRYALLDPENAELSDREIGELCGGVHHGTVADERHVLTARGELKGRAAADSPDRSYKPNASVRGGMHRQPNGTAAPNGPPPPDGYLATVNGNEPATSGTGVAAANEPNQPRPGSSTGYLATPLPVADPVPTHSATDALVASEVEKARTGLVSARNSLLGLLGGPLRDQLIRLAELHAVPVTVREEPTTSLEQKLGSDAIVTRYTLPAVESLLALVADLAAVHSGELELTTPAPAAEPVEAVAEEQSPALIVEPKPAAQPTKRMILTNSLRGVA